MRDETHVWLVDAHAEGDRGADHDAVLAQEALLVRAALCGIHSGVVRQRGDAYYAKSLEPRTEDPDLAAGFDPLAYLVERAHAQQPRVARCTRHRSRGSRQR